jgi:hypothetical protein
MAERPYNTGVITADMATRTVRLDEEAEMTLKQIREATGIPISEGLKRGLRALHEQIVQEKRRTSWEGYSELDIGQGGRSLGPATESRRLVLKAIGKKHGR